LAIKKEENSAICNNMGEYGGYYSKWNELDPVSQILYDFIYMYILKNSITLATRG
jgi:hypothetical protein